MKKCEWTINKSDEYHSTECGTHADVHSDEIFGRDEGATAWKFCPYCGEEITFKIINA